MYFTFIIERQKNHSNYFVPGPSVRRTFWLSSGTPFGYLLMSCPELQTKTVSCVKRDSNAWIKKDMGYSEKK